MKAKILAVLAAALTAMSVSACRQKSDNKMMEKKKVLVVYFSATGTTAAAAQMLAEQTGGALCEIVPEQPYTPADLNWHNAQSRSSVEMADVGARPAIKPANVNLANFDYVFIGYPIWWDLAPRAVNTFIESHDLSGKILIPFATSGGSTIDGSVRALRETYPALKWQKGRLLNGANEKKVKAWLEEVL